MAWIESHQDLRSNPKTRRAARRLGIPEAQLVGHLHFLWHWALDHAEDGDLTPFDADDLADAAGYDGDPDVFFEALIQCGPGEKAGFIEQHGAVGDPDEGRTAEWVLHDWWQYAGKLVARRRRDAARKANAARKAPEQTSAGTPPEPPADSGGPPAELHRNSNGTPPEVRTGRVRTEPNSTEPNRTEPNQEHDDADASPPAPDPVEETFEDFWTRYPRGRNGKPGGGGAKKPAWSRWKRMSKADREAALAAVDHYRRWCESPEGEFAAHAATWLNQDRWEQWQEPAPLHLIEGGDGGLETWFDEDGREWAVTGL